MVVPSNPSVCLIDATACASYGACIALQEVEGHTALSSREDFRQQLALAHLGSMGKAIIGAGGLDESNPPTYPPTLCAALLCSALHCRPMVSRCTMDLQL
jgi:hypothetical protein